MSFRILSHTADTGIEATAPSFPDLLAELARGMFATMAIPTADGPTGSISIEIEAGSLVDLVVDTLSELLYRSEIEDLFLHEFRVKGSTKMVTVEASAIPRRHVEQTGPAIKAVTYHDLTVEQRPEGWYARVYFDV